LASVCLLPALAVLGVPAAAAQMAPAASPKAAPAPLPSQPVKALPVHAAHAAAATNPGDTVQAIVVSGNHRIDAQTIISYMVVQPGQPFDAQAINQSLKTLYATGLFKSVSITRQGADLDVAVQENPLVAQVFFSGNKALDDKAAQAAIALKARAVYTPAAAEADRRALLDAYAKKGYYNATVTPDIIFLPDNRVNVVFNVVDGNQTLISRINFIGNDHFSQGRLREVVSSRQSAWYRFLSSSDQYDPERIEYDEYLLHKFYFHEGYADFNVISANAALSPDRKSFYLTFTISEGQRYRISSVKVISNIRTLSNAELRGLVPLAKGNWFDGDALQEGVDAVNKRALDLGYAFAQVNPKVDTDPKTHTIAITLNVINGPRVYIQRIDITGNTRTEDQVIRRQLTVAEGDAYNQSQIDQSTKNIKNLGYFKDEKITTSPGSTPQQVILNTAVTEQATGQFSLGGGYSTELGALVNAGISQNNFLGTGTDASINALLAQRGTQINIGVTDPYFLDRNLIAGADLFRSVTDSYTAAAESYSYSESDIGGDVRLGYRFNQHVRQTFTYTLSARDVYDIPTGSSVYIYSEQGGTTLSQISQTLSFDYLDDDTAPTSGFNFGITTDFAGAGGSAKYVRVSPSIAYYIPLERVFGSKDWVLKFSASAGDLIPIFGYHDNIVDRFFLGGDNLRGFADGGVGVHDQATGDSVGGRVIITQSSELHFPLPVSKDIGISGFAFVDVGTLYGATAITYQGKFYPLLDNSAPRVAAGIGVSWNTPFGLINLSLAQPIVKYEDDQIQQFRVSFGTRF
jgi:outer membrane protein insertion porin family